MLSDERYKKLMEYVGLPNSRSLLQALKQCAMEAVLNERAVLAKASLIDHWAFKNPGAADQYKCEARACRKALGFDPDADDVSPNDLKLAIAAKASQQVQGDDKAIEILKHHGWIDVNSPPYSGEVEICVFWCDKIYFGKAEYKNGSYFSEKGTMLDTPSFWREMPTPKQEPVGTNRYGLDMSYMVCKLNILIRDIERYKPDEAARTLARLSLVADQNVFGESEFCERMRATMWSELKSNSAPPQAAAIPAGFELEYIEHPSRSGYVIRTKGSSYCVWDDKEPSVYKFLAALSAAPKLPHEPPQLLRITNEDAEK